ncbi:MAG: hypothetical protein ACHQJ6_05635 [Candidatus Berkiellales bacterium]
MLKKLSLILILIIGCLIRPCLAANDLHHKTKRSDKMNAILNIESYDFQNEHYPLTPSHNFSQLFQVPWAPAKPIFKMKESTPHILSVKKYRQLLRDTVAWSINNNIRLGLDSFKVCPLDINNLQAAQVETNAHTGRSKMPSARGYGVELKVILD